MLQCRTTVARLWDLPTVFGKWFRVLLHKVDSLLHYVQMHTYGAVTGVVRLFCEE